MRAGFSFYISGVSVAVMSDDRALLNKVRAFFAGYAPSDDAGGAGDVCIRLSPVKAPYGSPDRRTRPLFSYGRVKGYTLAAGALLLSDGATVVVVDSARGTADAYVHHAIWARGSEFVSIFLTMALVEMLRRRGLYYLHAGAVSGDGRAILLCGMAMSGKTTLTLGLVRHGYTVCSDDAVFLRHRGRKVSAVGFKKDVHVTKAGLDRYRDLLGTVRPPRAPFKKASIPYRIFRTVDSIEPDIILFMERGAGKTRVTPVSETQALSLLIPQSLMVFFDGRYAERHLAALAALVRRARAYRCVCGRDLLDDPAVLLDSIERR